MAAEKTYNIAVVGGGFFGSMLALQQATYGKKVVLFEAERDLLTRASFVNQARVHGGYHYPRSFLTASRSRANLKKFVHLFQNAIDSTFTKLYAIARNSAVTADQFRRVCERIDAPLRLASEKNLRLFNSDRVEGVFEVEEFAFNAEELRKILLTRLLDSNVKVITESRVDSIAKTDHGEISLRVSAETDAYTVHETWICAYSAINEILRKSQLPLIELKHELAEICLVHPPPELAHTGVTIMDGPYFSIMPFPAKRLHSFTHVRYTPHASWTAEEEVDSGHSRFHRTNKPISAFHKMQSDATRFLPVISGVDYAESLWETKCLLPRSESNDSRPILLKQNHGMNGLHVVLGGKIDNVFDVLDFTAQEQ